MEKIFKGLIIVLDVICFVWFIVALCNNEKLCWVPLIILLFASGGLFIF